MEKGVNRIFVKNAIPHYGEVPFVIFCLDKIARNHLIELWRADRALRGCRSFFSYFPVSFPIMEVE
jgi:hypothetical protein